MSRAVPRDDVHTDYVSCWGCDSLHAEIRTLNDALTAANERMAAEIQRAEQARDDSRTLRISLDLANDRLARYIEGAVLRSDHDKLRALYQSERAQHAQTMRELDALCSVVQEQDNARTATLATERLAILQALGDAFSRMAYGPEEREALSALYAHLAEHGKRAHAEARQIAEAHRTARREP